MHLRFCLISFFLCILFLQSGNAQVDSIFDQGSYRTFIVHLPAGYNENTDYPIVLNLHGLGSTGFEQYLYSEFHLEADEKGFIVVYPDAINNSWDLFGDFDVTFLTHLIDTLRERYSTTDCLFSMGMSQGGFLSYKLTCELPYEISAIASVTGNMITPWQASCTGTDPTPVMQFHGTADAVVPYNGTFGIPPVEETIDWWVNENDCSASPDYIAYPDIDPNDGSTAESFSYTNCDEESNVVFYKITGGGHSWPGAIAIPAFGSTNQDIHASSMIADFFEEYCQPTTGVVSFEKSSIRVYPNPAQHSFTVDVPDTYFTLNVYDCTGRKMLADVQVFDGTEIDCSEWMNGMFFVHVVTDQGISFSQLMIKTW